ncbi:MAG: AmmeMemoRadiSam system protein A, partial [Calditrichaeota bacterium]
MKKNRKNRPPLPLYVREQLLYLARQSIADHLFQMNSAAHVYVDPLASFKAGAFVTLTLDGQLRGCIGLVEALEKVPIIIREMAVAAATRDPRFDPVTQEELVYLDIEISILSELFEIQSPDEIVIGQHGLLVRTEHHQGLLLPQVAEQTGWNAREFLSATCRKAGLAPDYWEKNEIQIFAFNAEIFSEQEVREEYL